MGFSSAKVFNEDNTNDFLSYGATEYCFYNFVFIIKHRWNRKA